MVYEETQHFQLPRLTGTLRAFSKVSKKFVEPDFEQEKLLIKKRKEELQKQRDFGEKSDSKSVLSWENLVLKLVPNLNDSKHSKLKMSLDKLKLNIVKQFLNEDFNDITLLNEASLFVFEVFYDNRNYDNHMSNSNFQNNDKIMKKLREKFGQFARHLFDNCKELMETIYNDLKNSNRINLLDELLSSRHFEILTADDVETDGSYFGENLKFISFYDKIGRLFEIYWG